METQAKRKVGRPVVIGEGSTVISVRVPMEQHKAIATEATAKRWSVAEVVRVALEGHIASNCKLSSQKQEAL
jgi:hypothetical protein